MSSVEHAKCTDVTLYTIDQTVKTEGGVYRDGNWIPIGRIDGIVIHSDNTCGCILKNPFYKARRIYDINMLNEDSAYISISKLNKFEGRLDQECVNQYNANVNEDEQIVGFVVY